MLLLDNSIYEDKLYKEREYSIMEIREEYSLENEISIFKGDCLDLLKSMPDESCDLIITSPPYCIGKEYEKKNTDIESFVKQQERIIEEVYRVLKVGGSVCWQVGYHITEKEVIPLDFYVYQVFNEYSKDKIYPLKLRNRIVWTFGHGLNPTSRFSGRHEMILWFTKGDDYPFELDEVRVPQKYPGKRYYRGAKKGQLSGNKLGKNPSDIWRDIEFSQIWDIPNVKANHVEKTEHPCQFPVALPTRLIKALCPMDGVVLDPYMGAGTTGVATVLEKRKFVGAELTEDYYKIAKKRIQQAIDGTVRVRPDKPVAEPNPKMEVARLPEEFRIAREKVLKNNN